MERIVYYNGNYIPESTLTISAYDLGFKYGAVFYESVRTFKHKPFKLPEHMKRLENSLRYVGLYDSVNLAEIEEALLEVIRRNVPFHDIEDDLWLNLEITPGAGAANPLVTVKDMKPTVLIYSTVLPYNEYVNCYDHGKRVVISNVRNVSNQSFDMRVKHRSRLHFYLAKLECAKRDPGAFAILTDLDGNITEGTGANIFAVKDGALYTPKPQNILNGISRQTVIELANELKIPVIVDDLSNYDFYTADEAFFSTSSYCILPICSVDGKPVRQVPGEITLRLISKWSEIVGVDIIGQAKKFANIQKNN